MKPRLLRICRKCYRYTLEQTCPICGGPTEVAHPPPFSPDDKYLELRIRALRGGDEAGAQGKGDKGEGAPGVGGRRRGIPRRLSAARVGG